MRFLGDGATTSVHISISLSLAPLLVFSPSPSRASLDRTQTRHADPRPPVSPLYFSLNDCINHGTLLFLSLVLSQSFSLSLSFFAHALFDHVRRTFMFLLALCVLGLLYK